MPRKRSLNDRQCSLRWKANHHREILLYGARYRARKEGIECSLTLDDIQIPSHCPVLGVPLTRLGSSQGHHSPSVDRKNLKYGYLSHNIRIISQKANRIKNDATAQELAAVLEYVREIESSVT